MQAGSRKELHSTKMRWRGVTEPELLDGMRKGSYGAYVECYCRFAPMLHGMARRRGVPEEDRRFRADVYRHRNRNPKGNTLLR
jgi:hypothetical protein